MSLQDIDWGAVAAISGLVALVGSLVAWFVRRSHQRRDARLQPWREEVERLRRELDRNLQLPRYWLDAFELQEKATEAKIVELQSRLEKAQNEQNESAAHALQGQLREIRRLRTELERLTHEKDQLSARLEHAILAPPAGTSENAVSLPSGVILLVRHRGRCGALKAIDQGGRERGCFIKYAWWYQPDGSGVFTNQNAQSGIGEAAEGNGGPSPKLEIGDITLEWSMGGDGFGWVYYGPRSTPSPEYELCVTRKIAITQIDATLSRYQFHTAPALAGESTDDNSV